MKGSVSQSNDLYWSSALSHRYYELFWSPSYVRVSEGRSPACSSVHLLNTNVKNPVALVINMVFRVHLERYTVSLAHIVQFHKGLKVNVHLVLCVNIILTVIVPAVCPLHRDGGGQKVWWSRSCLLINKGSNADHNLQWWRLKIGDGLVSPCCCLSLFIYFFNYHVDYVNPAGIWPTFNIEIWLKIRSVLVSTVETTIILNGRSYDETFLQFKILTYKYKYTFKML